MTTTPEAVRALIHDFVGCYIDKPDALRLEFQDSEAGAVYWMMKGDFEDEGKLIGARGSNVDALKLLVEDIGHRSGKLYTLSLVTVGGWTNHRAPRVAARYDTARVEGIVGRLLKALGVEAALNVWAIDSLYAKVAPAKGGADNILTFAFTIRAASAADYARLTGTRRANGDTIERALATLLRAIGKRDGVEFKLSTQE